MQTILDGVGTGGPIRSRDRSIGAVARRCLVPSGGCLGHRWTRISGRSRPLRLHVEAHRRRVRRRVVPRRGYRPEEASLDATRIGVLLSAVLEPADSERIRILESIWQQGVGSVLEAHRALEPSHGS